MCSLSLKSPAIFRLTFYFLALIMMPVSAQQQDVAKELGYIDQALIYEEKIEESLQQIQQFKDRQASHKGIIVLLLDRRIESERIQLLNHAHKLVELVIEQQAANKDPGRFKEVAEKILMTVPEKLADRGRQLLSDSEPVTDVSTMSPSEQIALLNKRRELADRLITIYKSLAHNIKLSRDIGLDAQEQEELLIQTLSETAANHSIILELAREQEQVLKLLIKAIPDDKELLTLREINKKRVLGANNDLRELVDMMQELDLSVTYYKQQLLTSSATVTTDILDLQVIKEILNQWWQKIVLWASKNLPGKVFNLLLFFLIIWATLILARLTRRFIDRGFKRIPNKLSKLMQRMIISSLSNIVIILGLLFGLTQMGVSVTPLLAGIGIVGFIIGFALQDTLGNFASGIMILLYRPYDVGDLIETNGVLGKVSHMSTVNTTVLTIDNQTMILPNSKIWSDVIRNVTAQRERRVDMTFSIGYTDDIAKAEEILNKIVEDHDKVLNDPPPLIKLHALGESSVDFVVRPWVKTEDYWDVYWDITRSVKRRFDEENITIPFPQRDVHLFANDKITLSEAKS